MVRVLLVEYLLKPLFDGQKRSKSKKILLLLRSLQCRCANEHLVIINSKEYVTYNGKLFKITHIFSTESHLEAHLAGARECVGLVSVEGCGGICRPLSALVTFRDFTLYFVQLLILLLTFNQASTFAKVGRSTSEDRRTGSFCSSSCEVGRNGVDAVFGHVDHRACRGHVEFVGEASRLFILQE